MKMTLAELVLLPVCFIVSAGLVVIASLPNQAQISYRWMGAFNGARFLHLLVANPDAPIAEANLSDVNSWFSGTLDADHPLSSWGAEYHCVDPWGNPYVCVQRGEHMDDQLLPRHVYSNGRDGISSSDGNDADDLNSWDDDSIRYYIDELNTEARLSLFGKIGLILPFVFPCCVYIKRRLLGNPFRTGENVESKCKLDGTEQRDERES